MKFPLGGCARVAIDRHGLFKLLGVVRGVLIGEGAELPIRRACDEDAAHYAKEFEQPMPVYGDPDQPTQWEFHVF